MMHNVGRSSIKMLKHIGSAYRSTMMGTMTEHVTGYGAKKEVAGLLDVSGRYLRKAAIISKNGLPAALLLDFKPGQKRKSLVETECNMMTKYFKEKTGHQSGSKTETRDLNSTMVDFDVRYYADFPMLLRDLAAKDGDILEQARLSKKPTRFQKSLLSANDHPPKDPKVEKDTRTKKAQLLYQAELARAKAYRQTYAKGQAAIIAHATFVLLKKDLYEMCATDYDEEFDGNIFIPNPVCSKTFWKTMKSCGLKWTTKVYPTECPLHDTGPKYKEELKENVRAEMTLEGDLKDVRCQLKDCFDKRAESKILHVPEDFSLVDKIRKLEVKNVLLPIKLQLLWAITES